RRGGQGEQPPDAGVGGVDQVRLGGAPRRVRPGAGGLAADDRVGRPLRNGRVHVGLDGGRGEGGVIDADVVDQAGEHRPRPVPAYPQRVGGGGDAAPDRAAAHLGAVEVHLQGRAVEGGRQERPLVQRQLRRPGGALVG